MIDFDFAENCCGCRACENMCPVNAIEMHVDNADFLFPFVDIEKCIKCGKCDSVCPYLNSEKNRQRSDAVSDAWLYASRDSNAKMRSASGGAFYELAKSALLEDYAIIGCVWNRELCAEHIVGLNKVDLERMQGSKYVQSDTKNTYKQLKEMLESGKKVLFSGTPCQAEAAHNIAMSIENGKYREQLITVGVLCHGVAAPKAWSSYKKWLEKIEGSPLINVNFRNKEPEGYKKSYCKYEYQSGDVKYMPTFLPTSKYIEATLVYNLAIRKSCSQCVNKGITSACDIILGDWYAAHNGEGELGTSCIIAFTKQGKRAVTSSLVGLRDIAYEEIVRHNAFIEKSVDLGINRDKFLGGLDEIDMWNKVERLYPRKYILKYLLVKLKLFDVIKKVI